MIFTSYTYVAFLLLIFLLYWTVGPRARNPLLIAASYAFYATWNWRFAFLLLALSLFNWAYALWLRGTRWQWSLSLGVGVNLGALVYFKYTNFILLNVADAARLFGSTWTPSFRDIVLPLGISFFTFQGTAYLVDVAAGEEPLEQLEDFLLFKALWPQLIAGPIIRLAEIRSQITSERSIAYEDLAYGSRRILFGFFKKVVLADNLAPYVDIVFSSSATPHMIDTVTGALGFGLQIYFDFSAYSDIAIGSARLFGFRFPENFNWPYAATSPREFWNRWHMTLSRWIRDYLFTPMALTSRDKPKLAPVWLLIAMTLCGLWHGAQWTFVVWGAWHGLLLVTQPILRGVYPGTDGSGHVSMGRKALGALVTLVLVYAGWIIFRAPSLSYAWTMISGVLTLRGGLRPSILRENVILFVGVLFAGLMAAQLIAMTLGKGRIRTVPLLRVGGFVRPAVYALMVLAIVIFDESSKAFIYFQF